MKFIYDETKCKETWQQYQSKRKKNNILCFTFASLSFLFFLALIPISKYFAMYFAPVCWTGILCAVICMIAAKCAPRATLASYLYEYTQDGSIKDFEYELDGNLWLWVWIENTSDGNVKRYHLPCPKYTYNTRVTEPTLDIVQGEAYIPYPPEKK